jgi:hypothetical protein
MWANGVRLLVHSYDEPMEFSPPAGLGKNLTAAGVTSGSNYTVSFNAVTANTYTRQAVATGTQTKDTPPA